MDINTVLSIAATVASLSISLVGFPFQIWKNYKNKNTSGIAYLLFVLSFISYTLWSLRAFFIGDWYMFTAYLPGVIFSIVILFQIYIYKKGPR